MPQPHPEHNLPEYSVSEIAGALKRTVEDRFGFVRVRGEISGWRGPHSSGHGYFRLKDDKAVLEAVCWKGTLAKMGFKMEEGLEVIASGKITTYPGKSSYQIVVERMEPAGAGALMALLEKRKAELAKEGLFAPERKRPLPYLPTTIGIITSPTGAVIRDILHRLGERFPVRVLLWPVAVQGEGAAEQVANAIQGFNRLTATSHVPKPDLLIVARGGGSIEDLWAFNEEVVVRAVANSVIPLISAVGHETDTTLIDFASDRRAPTPTAAAEIAVPVRDELLMLMAQTTERLQIGVLRSLSERQEKLRGLARGLPKPSHVLDPAVQRLDDWGERLSRALPALVEKRQQALAVIAAMLKPQLLAKEIKQKEELLGKVVERLQPPLLRFIARKQEALQFSAQMLENLSYTNVLKRGFALVKDKAGKPVTSAVAASTEKELRITFHDGEVPVKS